MSRQIQKSIWQNSSSSGDWKRLITRGRLNRKLTEAKRIWPLDRLEDTEAWIIAARNVDIPSDWDV